MGDGRSDSGHRSEESERSGRISYGIALAIALLPIPAALLISLALGDPPWRARPPRPAQEESREAPADHGHR